MIILDSTVKLRNVSLLSFEYSCNITAFYPEKENLINANLLNILSNNK